MWRAAHHGLRQLFGGRDPKNWHPLLAVYYLTYACDLRCPYCSDGQGRAYHELRSKVLPGHGVIELLRRIRRYSDHLVITGGEPLLHKDVDDVLRRLPEVGFDGVVFTTNGKDALPHLDALAAVDHLVFSLDTLDEEKADNFFGGGPGVLKQILKNLDAALAQRPKKQEIIISAVATPDNLEDLHGLYDFAKARGLRFALCPQLVGVKAHPDLAESPAYVAIFERLIAERRAGGPVNGSVKYLEYMRDFREFDCRPSAVLAISPMGDIFYPCLELGNVAGNLLDEPDLQAIRAAGRNKFGPEPKCDNRCHSACALGFSLALADPRSLADEALFAARAKLAGR